MQEEYVNAFLITHLDKIFSNRMTQTGNARQGYVLQERIAYSYQS